MHSPIVWVKNVMSTSASPLEGFFSEYHDHLISYQIGLLHYRNYGMILQKDKQDWYNFKQTYEEKKERGYK